MEYGISSNLKCPREPSHSFEEVMFAAQKEENDACSIVTQLRFVRRKLSLERMLLLTSRTKL